MTRLHHIVANPSEVLIFPAVAIRLLLGLACDFAFEVLTVFLQGPHWDPTI